MIEAVPLAIDDLRNHSALAFVRDLSTHSDLWDKLWGALKQYKDVETFCPDPANYRYAVAYVGSRIFAFAVGMSNIYVRLDPDSRARALAKGALDDEVPDSAWVYFRLWQADRIEPDFREFVDLAYVHAKQTGQSAV
jgi:hypothetical protein